MKTELNEEDIKKAIQFWLWEQAGISAKTDDIMLYKDSVMTEQIYADIQTNKHTHTKPEPEQNNKVRHHPRGG